MHRKTFAEELREKRIETGITFRDLAKALGVKSGTLQYYDKGLAFPSREVLKKICSLFGWDLKNRWIQIQKEKSPKEVKPFLDAAFPEIRTALLNSYDQNIFSSENQASLKEIKEELETAPIHPIEITLFYTTMKQLEKKGVVSFKNDSGCLFNIADEAKKKRIEKSGIHWVYDKRLHLLTWSFEEKIDKLNHLIMDPDAPRQKLKENIKRVDNAKK